MHTGERPFVCIEPECGRSFAQVTNLNNHMKSHHKIQQYVCNQCPRRFTQVTSLNQHLLLHSGLSGLICPQCPEKTFKTQVSLQQHMKTHGLSFPYECSKCDEKFLQMAHFNQHMALHEEFKFRCTMCASSFNQESLLKKHMQRHIEGRYHQCSECGKGFTLKNQLNKHIQLEHASTEAARLLNKKRTSNVAGKHNCYFDNCDAYFDSAELLNQHLTSIHGLALVKSHHQGHSGSGNHSGGGGSKKQHKMEIMFTDQLKHLKNDEIPISLPIGISLPSLQSFNASNMQGLQHQQMIVTQPMNVVIQQAQQHAQQIAHHHNAQAIHISKDHIKDIKNKCHECNIIYANDTDFRVHMYYKHFQNANKM